MKQDKHAAESAQLMRIIRPALSQNATRNLCGSGKDVAILAQRRQAIDEWRANHPVPSRNPKLEVTAALAEAERAIKASAQAYAAVRRAMATTAPK